MNLKIILTGFLFFAVGLSAIFFISCGSSSIDNGEIQPPSSSANILSIGVLTPITGSNYATGLSVKAGLELAAADINSYLAANDTFINSVSLEILNTETDTAVALTKLTGLKNAGYKIIIGPQNSSALAASKDYADSNDLLLLSPVSTAPSLAIEQDNILRFAPVDIVQAIAIIRMLYEKDIKRTVAIYRNDNWGSDLTKEIESASGIYGITFSDSIGYSPETTDWTTAVNELSSKINSAVTAEGSADSVAVLLISLGEGIEIMNLSSSTGILNSVKWFGCDGNALIPEMLSDISARQFAMQTDFLASIYLNPVEAGETVTQSTFLPDINQIKQRITQHLGFTPNDYGLIAYDLLWIVTLSQIDNSNSTDIQTIINNIYRAADNYRGVNGEIILNAAGDRTSGGYGFYNITQPGSTYEWTLHAVYHSYSRDSIPYISFN